MTVMVRSDIIRSGEVRARHQSVNAARWHANARRRVTPCRWGCPRWI